MPDPRIEQIADVLVHYSLDIQPGQTLAIQGNVLAEPLIREIYRTAVQSGAHVVTRVGLPGLENLRRVDLAASLPIRIGVA